MIRLAHPPGYVEERAYVADVVFGELLGLDVVCVVEDRADVELTLGGHDGSVRLVDGLFATAPEDWLTDRARPREPLARAGGMPLLFGDDLLGGAFYLLTRYEELLDTERDAHGRFPAAASLAHREGFLERPLVHEYADALWDRVHAAWPRLERRRPTPRTLPSHDVDIPFCGRQSGPARLRTAAADLVRRRDPRLALARVGGRKDLCDTFDFLMDESEREGVRSAFYFIASPSEADRIPGYSLADPRIRALLRRIHGRGHEIGLHASYPSLDEPERIVDELEVLRDACAREGIEQERWGVRQHYLRWTPQLWSAYERAGLAYDTSVGFADAPGFRAGICREYPAFDLQSGRRLEVRERPLVAMEASVLQYLHLDRRNALQCLTSLRETCVRHGGDFTLLWHNNRLESHRERQLYRDALTGQGLR